MPQSSDVDAKKTVRLNPHTASLLLFCVYLWALTSILPDGINQSFSSTLLILCSFAAGIVLLISLLLSPDSTKSATWLSTPKTFPTYDLLLLSIPLTPIVQYLLLNQESLNFTDNLGLIVTSAGILGIAVLIVPWLLRRWSSFPLSMLLILALGYTLANMATLARVNNWYLAGEFVLQFGLWLAVLAFTAVLYRIDRSALRGLAVCFLLATTVHTVWQGQSDTVEAGNERIVQQDRRTSSWELAFAELSIRHKPDIFLMTYDGYVGNQTLLQLGIDNSAQEQYLKNSGFQIYPDIYSVAASSRATMSAVLGASSTLEGVAGFSPMLQVLKNQGYTTMGIFKSDYYFNGVGIGYDQGYPPPSGPSMALARAILEGQFRHDNSFVDVPHADFVQKKRQVIEKSSASPKFLYTHTGPGHSQNSGKCRDNETALFQERLKVANQEMRDDLSTILSNHPDALIIVNGDHGPYLTKNCFELSEGGFHIEEITPLDIQDRFGAFLAIRWPESRQQYPDDRLLIVQDVFPAVFSYLYQQPMVDQLRRDPVITNPWNDAIGGLEVDSGVIVGGRHDGERLYEPPALVQR